MTQRILCTPIFSYEKIKHWWTGDNVCHYLPGKYLWHVCNVSKNGFYQPIDDFALNEDIELTYLFYPHQPQHLYFKKPQWIQEFICVDNESEAKRVAKRYDYFINNYRYRGATPLEVNSGYSPDLKEINLYTVAYTHKAVFDYQLYLDDLTLTDRYADFLRNVKKAISPEGRPIIGLHYKINEDDPWKRHDEQYKHKYQQLIIELLDTYPEHVIVLIGEPYSWNYLGHHRIAYLYDYINPENLKASLNDYNPCLQFILAAYFCRDVDLLLHAISGFTLFIASIRPLDMKQPLPIFWGEKTFSGIDTCIEMNNWKCKEFENYRHLHPEDKAFQYYIHHFIHFARDVSSLEPYCLTFPNTISDIRNQLYLNEIKQNTNYQTIKKIKENTINALQYGFRAELHNLKKLETCPVEKNFLGCVGRLIAYVTGYLSFLTHHKELIEPDFYGSLLHMVHLAAKSLHALDKIDTETFALVQTLRNENNAGSLP